MSNLLLHLGVVLLLGKLLQSLGLSAHATLLGILLFSVHPLTVEPVAGISYRTDVLAALLLLLSIERLLHGKILSSLLFNMLALLAKETALLFPVVASPFAWKRSKRWLLGSIFLTVSFAFVRFCLARTPQEAGVAYQGGALGSAIANAPSLFLRSIALIFFPTFCPDRSAVAVYAHLRTAWPFWIGSLLVVLVVYVIHRRIPRVGPFMAGAALFIVPYTGLYPINMVLCDRYLYVPLLLAGGAVSALLSEMRAPRMRRVVFPFLSALIVLEGGMSLFRHPVWWSELALFEQTADCAEESHQAQYNYGRSLVERGECANALPYLRKAIALEPQYARAWLALGAAYHYCGAPDSALVAFQRTESISGPLAPVVVNIAAARLAMGDTLAAMHELRRALALAPGQPRAMELLRVIHGSSDGSDIEQ